MKGTSITMETRKQTWKGPGYEECLAGPNPLFLALCHVLCLFVFSGLVQRSREGAEAPGCAVHLWGK